MSINSIGGISRKQQQHQWNQFFLIYLFVVVVNFSYFATKQMKHLDSLSLAMWNRQEPEQGHPEPLSSSQLMPAPSVIVVEHLLSLKLPDCKVKQTMAKRKQIGGGRRRRHFSMSPTLCLCQGQITNMSTRQCQWGVWCL